VRVLTCNIRSGTDLFGRRRLAQQTAVVRAAQPDLVLLQEVASRWQADSIARAAGLQHVAFGAARATASGGFGNAVLSRFVLHDVAISGLPTGRVPGESRAILSATLVCATGAVRVLSTHFGLLPGEPEASAWAVVKLVQALRGPIILGGDLNRPAWWLACHGPLRRVLEDAATATPRGLAQPTFPSPAPLLRLDYLYVRDIAVREVRVIRATVSDHCPVVADLSLSSPR
jgi:endonuclease/exonuclease/phosphatase family metal-dependent hydrolase